MEKFPLGAKPAVAVAVSGGGDSVALVLLMQDWVVARGGKILALTVDHGLRADSRAEAEKVHDLLAARGVDHEILSWQGEKPATHIQERAREARYTLLAKACRERGHPVLAVAHNLEDQIETFWMRLAHGSGVDGLAAMAPVRQDGDVQVIRPVLNFSRRELRDICAAFSTLYIDDPSNGNEKFLRVRLRQFEDLLAAEGLSPQRLAQTLQKLESSREALRWMTARAMESCVTQGLEGAVLKREVWLEYPADLRRRVMAEAMNTVHPQDYPPGFEALENLCRAVAALDFSGRTLAGCMVAPMKNGDISIRKEAVLAAQ